ncbi:MAG TPA: prepilin-type N-terminal cleavage/methylation domain-containing protein [Candidatus Ozemobacteraceae bacterium]|nr:prepilin-type N-terminal cleavage/methylation domain-containing protein [Candidatus Ozemobacteraceae bacterium]
MKNEADHRMRERGQRRGRPGFTIIEVLLAMLIVGVGVVPVLSLFLTGSRTVEKGGLLLSATIAAQNILDRAKSDSFLWGNIPLTLDFPDPDHPEFTLPAFFMQKYKASGTLVIEEAPNHTVIGTGESEKNLIQISVIIRWIENNFARSTRLVTYRANTNSFDLKTSAKF